MRVLISGGGSAGHVNPALAIANTILKHEPDSVIGYVGTPDGIENRLVPKEFKMYHINIKGLKRKLSIENLKTAYLTVRSPAKAKKIIEEFKPDVVVGTGGYVCWPIARDAAFRGVHVVLHEANAIPGVAVKALIPFVDKVYFNFAETMDLIQKPFLSKCKHVGNPLRDGFDTYEKNESREKLGIGEEYKYVILSFGGSLGAPKINAMALYLMANLIKDRPDVLFMHSCGRNHYKDFMKEFKDLGLDKYKNLVVSDYFYDMPYRVAAADITINRAGAMTVSELAMAGKCSIFIPSPHVAENHQYKNAKVLVDKAAAFLFEEKDLVDGEPLKEKVESLLTEEGKETIDKMSKNIKQFAVVDANERIYRDIKRVVGTKRKKNIYIV